MEMAVGMCLGILLLRLERGGVFGKEPNLKCKL